MEALVCHLQKSRACSIKAAVLLASAVILQMVPQFSIWLNKWQKKTDMTHTGWQTHHTQSRSANTVVLPTRRVILHIVFEMGIILIIDKTHCQ